MLIHVASINFDRIYAPLSECIAIDFEIVIFTLAPEARIASTGEIADISIDAQFEAFRVDIIGESLDSVWKSIRIRNQSLGHRISMIFHRPTIVYVHKSNCYIKNVRLRLIIWRQ